jgi:hypothetical protein
VASSRQEAGQASSECYCMDNGIIQFLSFLPLLSVGLEVNMKPEIVLQNTAKGIVAHWYDRKGEPDQEIINLFGTHIIPTPYMNVDTMPEVVKIIKKLNPGYVVSAV